MGPVLLRPPWRVHVHGAELVPRTGPVVLASNHAGFLDGPMLVGLSPRGVHCLVKSEMCRGPLGMVLRAGGQIAIRRDRADRSALQAALGVLARGGVVGIFPEGSRGRGDMAEVRAGIAWLAVRSGAMVVPVACLGTRRTGESPHRLAPFGRRLDLVFGAPVDVTPQEGASGRQALATAAESIRRVLAEHVRAAAEATGQELPQDDPLAVRRGAEGDPG